MSDKLQTRISNKQLQARVDSLTAKLESFNTDGLKNVLTNLGVFGKGRTQSTEFTMPTILDAGTLTNIYRGDGFGKKVVDIYANEMTRQWLTFSDDTNNKVVDYFERIKAKKAINSAIKWSRLYGGSIVFMMIDDGEDWANPVNTNNIRSIAKLAVYDSTQVTVSKYYNDISQPTLYNEPEIYSITQNIRATGSALGSDLAVHETRILRFDGDELPNSLQADTGGWSDSVIQCCYNQLINMLQSYDYGSEMLHDYIISVIKLSGLANMLALPGGDKKIQDRIDLTARTRSVNNMVVLDKDDEYDKKASMITGLDKMIDKFVAAFSAVTGIPQMVLMGESPSGLASSGDNNIRNWYDSVKSEQEDILIDPINKLLDIVALATDSGVKDNAKIGFVFNPLWQHSTDELLANQNTKAQTDQIYIQNGVYTSDSAREHLVEGKQEIDSAILKSNEPPTYSDLNTENDDV